MGKNELNKASAYAGSRMLLTTKHSKSMAIAPPFRERLGAAVVEHIVDTDSLGTFTGEVERMGNALDCARRKCEMAMQHGGMEVEYALASEGSFGPHPVLGFVPCDHEILYFIDRPRDFHFHLSHLSEKTNYRMESLDSWEAVEKFASAAGFPSHALIVRPRNRMTPGSIYKGIDTFESLERAFAESRRISPDGKVWVETDMRAHRNPTRMKVIEELADLMALRLASQCPECHVPGWGRVRLQPGLECGFCGSQTRMAKAEIFGCVKCDYEESRGREDGLEQADPAYCDLCNP